MNEIYVKLIINLSRPTCFYFLLLLQLVLWKWFLKCTLFYEDYLSHCIQVQGISEKCTGTSKFGCHVIFWSIYLSKNCRKSGFISLSIYRIHTKKYSYYNFITNINIFQNINKIIYIWVIFISIILIVYNDPCFENKSSSLTLKYRPVHFSEYSCSRGIRPFKMHRIILWYCPQSANL